MVIADDITNLPSLHAFVKFPDGFPAARLVLQYKDYPLVAAGFIRRKEVKPIRSRRGEGAFAEEQTGEGGGRDGAAQVIENVTDPAVAVSAVEGQWNAPQCEEVEVADNLQTAPVHHSNVDAARVRDADAARQTLSGEQREPAVRERHGLNTTDRQAQVAPVVEDQTLIELRQDLSARLDSDDFGI